MNRSFARRALLPATAFVALICACDSASSVTRGDALVQRERVRSADLKSGADAQRLEAFYEARNWAPVWTAEAATQLQDVLKGAWRHGLSPELFTSKITSEDPSQRELQLTRAAFAYADALAHGMADPNELFGIYAVELNEVDIEQGLAEAAEAGRVSDWLEGLAPQDAEYRALSEAYLRYRERALNERIETIPTEGGLIRPGDSDPRVPQLRARLQADGYLQETPAPVQDQPQAQRNAEAQPPAQTQAAQPSTTYTEAMADALRAFQREQGIAVDGIVGPDTIEMLNSGPDDRARQLALNLEARRWLPRDPDPNRFDVNLPGAMLTWRRDGQPAVYRKVIVGEPENPTPHLAEPFSQLVVNPPWRVPQSIAEEEILPKGPGYMRANNMYVADNGMVVQRAGPEAALGLVKFDMQNRHAIYLHDTPAKSLFGENQRYFSHGCVRVEGAVDLARQVAEAHGKGAEFQAKLEAGEEAVVELGTEIPVRLLYHTAFLDQDGKIAFRPDMYGWDEKLAQALGIPAPRKRGVASSGVVTIGP